MAKPGTLTIDLEFRDLLDPLTTDEYNTLQANIIAHGCLDPIKIWNEVIVDGHNRYEICHANNVIFRTLPMYFDCPEDAMLWIIDHQGGRRNSTDMQKVETALKKKKILEKKAEDAKRAAGGDKKSEQAKEKSVVTDLSQPIKTTSRVRSAIAKAAGVSEGTVAAVQKIKASAAPELADAARKGEVSISAAATVAELPIAQQKTIAAAGPAKVKETASAMNAAKKKAAASKPKKKAGRVAPFKPAETTWRTPWLDLADVEQMALALIDELGSELVQRLAHSILRNSKGAQHV